MYKRQLNNQVNRNFNGKNQIPYNPNYSYNGYDVEYEVKKGDIEDSSGNTYTKVKKYYTNTPVEGTDHVGLIKYIYNVAGVCVMTLRVDSNDKRFDLNLAKGCYIVKVGRTVRKVSIH